MALNNKSTIEIVEHFLDDILKDSDISLWDINYRKIGSDWFLEVFIDKEPLVSFEDCEMVSQKLSEKLDLADPIKDKYFLEVSSPGIFRSLVKDFHFKKYLNHLVTIKLIRKNEFGREFIATLLEKKDNNITVLVEETKLKLNLKDVSSVKLYQEINF